MMTWTAVDFWMAATAMLTAWSCALLGSFLVVRRLSLMGDAITHAVLPGLAIAFLVTGSRDTIPMLIGASSAALLTALLTQFISYAGKVEEGASMGVVFTTLFALGLVMMVRAADRVDLDPSCVLYGALELTPLDTVRIAGHELPRAFVINAAVLGLNALVIALLYKEFLLVAFDPMLAAVQGYRPQALHQLLMVLTAITAVASFETVGSILVVAMLIVPAAAARLMTNRLTTMLAWSIVMATGAAWFGHLGALEIPGWFGFRDTSTAGMMAVAAGGLFGFALLLAPEQGLLAQLFRRVQFWFRIGIEDALSGLYRHEEARPAERARPTDFWLHRLWRSGLAEPGSTGWRLTGLGRERARAIVQSHRLWERYLVDKANVRPDQAHHASDRLEHVTSSDLREGLDKDLNRPAEDPHGRAIPRSDIRC